MLVVPAIDIRGGKCVRLFQGDYAKETVFSDNPAAMAEKWVGLGATRLHVVDLDGAKDGVLTNQTAIQGILAAVSSKVSGIKTNITTMEAKTDATGGHIDMTVEITDLKHLQRVLKSLRNVDGVLDVARATR